MSMEKGEGREFILILEKAKALVYSTYCRYLKVVPSARKCE